MTPQPLNSTTILGTWNYEGTRYDGVHRSGTITFNADGTISYNNVDADGQDTESGGGAWNYSGSTLSILFSGMSSWEGTPVGDSEGFFLQTTYHGSYNFYRP